jgi:TolA-binding protein
MESDVTQSAVFYKFWAWGETHRKQLLWGAIILAAAGLAAGFFAWWQNEKETSANNALSQAMDRPRLSNGQGATSEALLKVAAEYPNTDAAGRAVLLAAADLFAAGQYPQAQAQFDKYLRGYGGTPLTVQALLGMAACLDIQGKTNEAITAYKNIYERYPNDNVVLQAKFALARLYEVQNKLGEARDLYYNVSTNFSDSIDSEAASLRYEDLIAKHPELAPATQASAKAPAAKLEKP